MVDSINKAVLRQAQHERDLLLPFALSLSKGKSTLSSELLRQALGESVGMRGGILVFWELFLPFLHSCVSVLLVMRSW